MRVGLIHNSPAREPELVACLGRHGHSVEGIATRVDGVWALPLEGLDLIAVAGGDGTVSATLAALPPSRVPIAILPVGTANNIATSLRVPGDLDAAVDQWRTAQVRGFDIGAATGAWGTRRFVESVGCGLVAEGIALAEPCGHTGAQPDARLALARLSQSDHLDAIAAEHCRFTIDGVTHAARLLLLEVLNIGMVGPNLALAEASPFDATLTVVAAYAEHRPLLQAWIRGDTTLGRCPPLPLWQARRVELVRAGRVHVDDTLLDSDDVAVSVEAAAAVLVP
ncbi:MAG: diacylglycerol kinase family protein [Vicinamibacterales bacterium]